VAQEDQTLFRADKYNCKYGPSDKSQAVLSIYNKKIRTGIIISRVNNNENINGKALLYIIVEEKIQKKIILLLKKMKFKLHKNITNEKMSGKNGI
jgi:hypothetical protein